MTTADVERWRAVAMKLKPEEVVLPTIPIAHFLLESEAAAGYLERYWEPAPDGSRPGLSGQPKFEYSMGEDIHSLARAGQHLHTMVLFDRDPSSSLVPAIERASEVVGELNAGLEFVLDDGVEDADDLALAEAQRRAGTDSTRATLIRSLIDLAAIADRNRERMTGLADFDPALIDEATQLAARLTEAGPAQLKAPTPPDLDLRNRIFTLLADRVNQVRKAARYVFRKQPELIRQVTSAYERRKKQRRTRETAAQPE